MVAFIDDRYRKEKALHIKDIFWSLSSANEQLVNIFFFFFFLSSVLPPGDRRSVVHLLSKVEYSSEVINFLNIAILVTAFAYIC